MPYTVDVRAKIEIDFIDTKLLPKFSVFGQRTTWRAINRSENPIQLIGITGFVVINNATLLINIGSFLFSNES